MVEGLPANPSRYDMPKPSRLVLLDDLSGEDLFLRCRTSELALLIDAPQTAIKLTVDQLTERLRKKYTRGLEKGIYPPIDLLIGVGSTGSSLADNLNLGLPVIKVTPFRSKDPQGHNVVTTRSELSLAQEIDVVRSMTSETSNPTIGIVDDTVFSGKTLSEIYSVIEGVFNQPDVITLALTSVPAFLPQALKDKAKIISGLQIKTIQSGRSGLNSIDMKDLVTDDGLHLADGSSIAFMNEENWMRSWFGPNYDQAIAICEEIRNYMKDTTPRVAIFDWKRTLYDPDKRTLIDNAKEILEALHRKGVLLVLIGMGDKEMYQEVERLGLSDYFTHIKFLNEGKNASIFQPYIDGEQPGKTLVIGDRARGEVQVGNSLGATTIWIKQGKFADELPEEGKQKPSYETDGLAGLSTILDKIYNIDL